MAYSYPPTATLGYEWTAADHNTYYKNNFAASIPDVFTGKGSIFVGTGADAGVELPIGENDQVLMADSSTASGLKWSSQCVPKLGIYLLASLGSLPYGHQECDGTNGTPDLRNRFIVGAGLTYSQGQTGGLATINWAHTHTQGSTGSSASHTHTAADTGNESAHRHSFSTSIGVDVGGTTYVRLGYDDLVANGYHTHTFAGQTDAGQTHKHTIPTSGSAGSGHTHTNPTTASAGLSSLNVLPPYRAVYWVARVT